jgi:hypothetical protein
MFAGGLLWSVHDGLQIPRDDPASAFEYLFPSRLPGRTAALHGNTDWSIDFSAHLLLVRSTLLDTIQTIPVHVRPLDAYLDDFVRQGATRSLRDAFRRGHQERADQKRADQEGLVPDIALPVKLPGLLGSVIGQGGNIRVSGHQRITFSGESNWEVGQARTDFDRNSAWPDLGMEQELVLNLEGTVGAKVHIDVDHNSTAGAESQNKIKLSYKGDEDEIIQSIEAGDTQLSLPSTRFVGVNAQSKGLFGLKAVGRLGNLDVTMIASKQKGNAEEGRFLGQATLDTLIIQDIEYVANKYFALELNADVTVAAHPVPLRGLRDGAELLDLRVYYDDGNGNNSLRTGAVPGTLFLDGNDFGASEGLEPLDPSGSFVQLIEQQDFVYDAQAGVLEILPNFRLDDGYRLAVAYRRRVGGEVEEVGSSTGGLVLKLIKEPRLHPDHATWPYMLRNRYDLGARNIPAEGFVLKVERIVNEAGGLDAIEVDASGTPYIQVLGLDSDGDGRLNTDISVPENQFALSKGIVTIPLQPVLAEGAAEPDLLPFPWISTALDVQNPAIYETQKSKLLSSENAIYRLRAAFKQIRSSFSLGHINILPNSEVVRVDGRTLVRDKDYFIVYEVGQITFVTPPSPTSTVKINYEYAPFFDLAQKTLLGVRSNYRFLDGDGAIGATWLYESQRSVDQKPRVGREVGRIHVADVDAHVEMEPGFLTTLADAIPLVEASRPSQFRLEGEVAASLPNPNVRDYGYVDDMEAVETVFSLLGSRRTWSFGSTPAGADKNDNDAVATGPGGLPDSLDFGSAIWFNPDPQDLPRRDEIFDELPPQERNDRMTVLRLRFDPRGSDADTRRRSYMSIQRPLSSLGVDFANRTYLETWIAVEGSEAGVLHIDLGTVSEDQNRRNRRGELVGKGCFNTEDINRDGLLQRVEDVGLDQIGDVDSDDPVCGETECGSVCDDGNDDYNYRQGVYRDLNGTEDNNTLDTEDMDEDGGLDIAESLFRYTLDLSDRNDPRIVGGDREPNSSGRTWRRYRIPIADATVVVDGGIEPSLREIKHVRLWYDGVEAPSEISIANLDVVGSTWLQRKVNSLDGSPVYADEGVSAATVSTREDDKRGYEPPIGVHVERDQDGRIRNEQALALQINNLRPGHEALLVQSLFDAVDYTLYGGLEVFVQGRESQPEIFFRFGADSLNFYEWRVQVEAPGSASLDAHGWARRELDLQALTLFKDDAAKAGLEHPFVSEDLGVSVVGRPSLTRIKRMEIGVRNLRGGMEEGGILVPGSSEMIVADEVWIDDLRLTKVRRDLGIAARVSSRIALSDFANASVTWQYRDSEFHGLGTNRGQGADQTDWNGLGDLQLDRFLPPGWGVSMPFKGSLTKTLRKPRLAVGADVRLDRQRAEEEMSESTIYDASLRFSKKRRRSSPLANFTVDNTTARVSWRKEERNSFVETVDNKDLSGEIDWNWNQRKRREVPLPGPWGVSLLPSSLSFGSSYTLRSHDRYTKLLGEIVETSNVPIRDEDLENSYASTWAPFRALTFNHSITENRDLRGDGGRLGRQDRFNMRSGVSLAPKIGRWLAPKAGYTITYNENKSSEIQSAATEEELRNLQADGRVDMSLTLKPGQIWGQKRQGKRKSTARGRPRENRETNSEEDAGGDPATSEAGFWQDLGGIWTDGLAAIDPISTSWIWNQDRNDPNAIEGGGWHYMLGLGQLGNDSFYQQTRQGSYLGDHTLRTSGGVQLPLRLHLKASVSWSSKLSAYDNPSIDHKCAKSWTRPDLSLTWTGLESSVFLERYAQSSSLSSSWQWTRSMSGTAFRRRHHIDELDRVSTKRRWKPLLQWQTTWKHDVTSTFSHSTSTTFTREITRTQRAKSSSSRASFRYTLNTRRGLSLPLFGYVKLHGNVKAGLEVSREESSTFSIVPGVNWFRENDPEEKDFDNEQLGLIPDLHTRTWTIEPTMDYDFSRSVDGGVQLLWSENRNLRDDRTIRTVKVTLWTVFRF